MRFWNRLRHWTARARAEADLAEEIRLHREILEEHFAAEGVSRAEARKAAALRFGNTTAVMEESREQWTIGWLVSALADLRFAVRLARKQPLVSVAAVLTVAFGVGANTAVVSVLETLLLNPLGLPQAGRVVVARVRIDRLDMRHIQASAAEYRDLQSMPDAFAAATAMEGHYWNAQLGGEPVRLFGQAVTSDFFRVFNVQPGQGRFFSADDRDVMILSDPFWRSQFAGDPAAIGRAVMLDGRLHRIIGVAPSGFRCPAGAQAWTPLVLSPKRLQRRGYDMSLWLFARLKDGVTPPQAADRVNRYIGALKDSGYEGYGYGVELDPVAHFVAGDLRQPLWLLFAAATVALLTACANVAGLLLTRAAGRHREIAIRIAVGAGRARIVRQLLLESLLLGAIGGACGLLLAAGAVSLLTRMTLPGSGWLELVTLDRPMLVYGLAVALASGLLFGLAPAIQLVNKSRAGALVRTRRHRFQHVFVAAQVAGAFLLVAMTGLLLCSLWTVQRIQPGFDPSNLTTAYVLKPKGDPGFIGRLREAVNAIPGAESAALAYPLPFSGGGLTSSFVIQNRKRRAGDPEWHGEAYVISPEYLRTMRIPLLRGRNLADSDAEGAPLVCLIDSRLAERFFPGEDPLGRQIGMYMGPARIVGVVGTIRGTTLEEGSRPVVYYSMRQMRAFDYQAGIVVRSAVPVGAAIREAVRRTNSTVPVYSLCSMQDRISKSLGIRRALAFLLAALGGIALLLATVGIYGVVAQVVATRTSEIGIRMALGARPAQILTQFSREGLSAGIAGLVCGFAAAVYARKWVAPMLYQIRPFDATIYLGAAVCVTAILLAAIWWPASRAARIDPQQALRCE